MPSLAANLAVSLLAGFALEANGFLFLSALNSILPALKSTIVFFIS